jgi:N-acetyl sugar amidotransferase
MYRCNNCLNTSTRPRITFNHKGICNACQWAEEKKLVNWSKRQKILKNFFKNNNMNYYDCIIPVSGGKDGSYVSYTIKKKFNINPLCITVRPPLELNLGNENLNNFIKSGYEHLHITPNQEVMRQLNYLGFKYLGFPYYGWLVSIFTSILNIASFMNVKLVIYGEDGEVEYGGSDQTKNQPFFDSTYQKKIYFEGGYDKIIKKVKASQSEKSLFFFPSDKKLKKIKTTHWSYFENWDPYRNYLVAKKNCGLRENQETNVGTFTNYAQNDQALYALHTYLMYLKFGFGRATQDAGIDIRRGAMTRSQGINLVKLYDNNYPEKFVPIYLDYYKISKDEFNKIIDKWANKKIFKKIKKTWHPKFSIK